ncbi:MAG TPA: hypothetical protein VGP89_17950 [Candidatus Angelobacter sp.]|jgi:hypothetical protein|nr:hypothetical protein [Candidatus Angelobacter sp.]
MISFLRSLVHVANPYRSFPWWTVTAWLSWIALTLGLFGVFETLGMKRWHGAVPLTWVIRDVVPHLVLLAFGVFWVVHFVIQHNPAAK